MARLEQGVPVVRAAAVELQSVVVECSPVWTVVADSVGGACALGNRPNSNNGRYNGVTAEIQTGGG